MHKKSLLSSYLFVFSSLLLLFLVNFSAGQKFQSSFAGSASKDAAATMSKLDFVNPVTKISKAGCSTENLNGNRFGSKFTVSERSRICRALDRLTDKLNNTAWSPQVQEELKAVWNVFFNEKIDFRSMAAGISPKIVALAEAFPDKTNAGSFAGTVYLRSEKSDDPAFFQIILHELRHILDFYDTWKNRTSLSSMEIERRAYSLVGKLTMETPERENFAGVPKFWKESWKKFPMTEISFKRETAIAKYLKSKKFYRQMAADPGRQSLDFSYLNTPVNQNDLLLATKNQKPKGIALPQHNRLPETVSVINQNIRESNFELEKPVNPRDDKEILRVALKNEKKLYYGMSNFVYDQNIDLQCLHKGKVTASLVERNTVARTEDGNALFKLASATTLLPCVLNFSDLKTDFTNTFWASPALDKMPISFNGFQSIDGIRLAVYTVLEPGERIFAAMEAEYPHIRPFRVPVGTIYISPEDGQIVRFSGTSYPEETMTGIYAERVRCTYWVKAVRQKLNLEKGIWVTVHIGSVAVASVKGKVQPFNYTVKFENYRQSKTEMKILDDESEVIAHNTPQTTVVGR